MTPHCPDCSALDVDRNLAHDDTCPLGRALDAMMDEDRDWFATHPFAVVRHRPMKPAERSEFLMYGYWEASHLTRVQVIQVQPNLRVRHPYGGGLESPYSAQQVERVRARFDLHSLI